MSLATFQLEPHQIQRMIELSAPEYGREKARQDALMKTYSLDKEGIQELCGRMNMSERTIRDLIRSKRLRTTPSGDSKGYRVTEQAIREYFGDVNPK